MPKRFHLNQPDHAKALADALATCQDISDQQRLLAMRLAASGQMTVPIAGRYPLDGVQDALGALRKRAVLGRQVLDLR